MEYSLYSKDSDINILHVEDNPDTRQLIKSNLKKENDIFNITSVANPTIGLDLLEENKYDCIISDYNMPEMNGLQFLDIVRQKYDEELPFILLTGAGSEDVASNAIRKGANDYIKKDINDSQYKLLANRISNYVSDYRTKQELSNKRQELRYEQKILNQAINGMKDIFYVMETSGEIIRLNKSGEKFINRIINQPLVDNPNLFDVFPNDQKCQIKKSISTVKNGNHTRINLTSYDNQNNKIELEIKHSPLQDSQGNVLRIVGIARDVTEENEYKRTLKNKNKKLDKFAKIISHDIRNPLSIARGHLNLYIEENGTHQNLEKTQKSINRIETILDDILEIAKTTDEKINKEKVNIQSIIQDCWENIDRKNSNLTIDTTKEISLNKKLASRLFENMFKNSIKHGGDDVEIKIGSLENGFYIEDNGKGIPKEKRSKIFNLNYTTSETGEGLGLTIVKYVCDSHNWDIIVTESSTGGARFEITNI